MNGYFALFCENEKDEKKTEISHSGFPNASCSKDRSGYSRNNLGNTAVYLKNSSICDKIYTVIYKER